MTANGWVQIAVFTAIVTALARPLGGYMAAVFEGRVTVLRSLERVFYRLCGTDEAREQHWLAYGGGMLLFHAAGFALLYGLQRAQYYLPFNPERQSGVSPDSTFNTAVSFVTNTNWQSYTPEATMGYLVQMAGLTVQNFTSAAAGIVLSVVLIRGFARRSAQTVGNFWVDTTRCVLYILAADIDRRRVAIVLAGGAAEPRLLYRSHHARRRPAGHRARSGVELAGTLAELAKAALARDFRRIDPRTARIVLVEAGPRLLPGFHPALSAHAARALQRLGVEVRVGSAVTGCDAAGAELGNERIESRTLIWAAGVAASPAAFWPGAACDRAGRVLVNPDLSVPGWPEVFVIGDAARLDAPGHGPLPGVAPVAKQQGRYVARVIAARLAGRPAPPPFAYRNYGDLATIGRREAVVDFGWLRLTGRLAWLVWSVAHIYFLIGFRNRLAVALDWLWSYLTYQRGARLITVAQATSSTHEIDYPP